MREAVCDERRNLEANWFWLKIRKMHFTKIHEKSVLEVKDETSSYRKNIPDNASQREKK